MSDDTAHTRSIVPALDRRGFIVGGAALVSSGVLASAARGHDGEPGSLLIAGVVAEHASRTSIDVFPVDTNNSPMRQHRVRVTLDDDAARGDHPLRGFEPGKTVGIRLRGGHRSVEQSELGGDDRAEVTVGLVSLVLGEGNDLLSVR
jgi:hypothetical protein